MQILLDLMEKRLFIKAVNMYGLIYNSLSMMTNQENFILECLVMDY